MNVLGWLYVGLLVVLGLHGMHRWLLVFRLLRHRSAPGVPTSPVALPFVTVQLPVYNERDVVARVVQAAVELDWPRDKFEVQLLDDSTDDTLAAAAGTVARARAAGVSVQVIHREDRVGFKAGALAHGLAAARGELLAVFDADFVPERDFLRRLTPHFHAPEVGMVQARWGHLNADASWLTRAQACLLDAHFGVEHRGRSRAGLWFNFNGTAGIWRREAIEAAGGWAVDTLTEDLDLSYRAQLAGWRFVYRDDVVVPAELPSSIPAFLAQQRRWAKGSVEVLRKLGPRLIRANVPWRVRIEALVHLTGNLAWPLALAVALLMPAVVAFGAAPTVGGVAVGPPVFALATVSHAVFLGVATGARRRDIPLALALGLGLAVSQTGAVFEAILGRRSTFVRTPKQGASAGSYSGGEGRALPIELALATWEAAGFCAAALHGNVRVLPFFALFVAAFTWVGFGGVAPITAARSLAAAARRV